MTTAADTPTTLELERDSLTLVVVSPDYFRTGDQNGLMPNGDDDSRTYYATTSRDMGEGWATILEPVENGRLSSWDATDQYRDLIGSTGQRHNGWNIRRRYLSPVVSLEEALTVPGERLEYGSPVTVGERLEYADDRGEGDSVSPAVAGDRGTVEWVDGGGDLIRIVFDDGHTSTRSRNRFRRVVEEASQEPSSGPETGAETFTSGGDVPDSTTAVGAEERTYSREEVDRMLEEARTAVKAEADAALEEFKEHANEIAVRYAKDNDLCGNFEWAMAEIGLMGREEWDEAHRVTHYVTFRVDIDATPGEDPYDIRYRAANWLAEQYGSTIVDYATEVQDDDGETVWSD